MRCFGGLVAHPPHISPPLLFLPTTNFNNTQAKSQAKRKNKARDVPLIVSSEDGNENIRFRNTDLVITAMPSRHHEKALTICGFHRLGKRLRTLTFQHDSIKASVFSPSGNYAPVTPATPMTPMQFDDFESESPS